MSQEIQLLLDERDYMKRRMLRAILDGHYALAHILAKDLASIRRELDGRFDVTTLKHI